MEITINNNSSLHTLKFTKNLILFGESSIAKNEFINNIIDNLNKKESNIFINGKKFNNNDYNIFIIDETDDFDNTFKFAKNNPLKQLIYDNVLNKINQDKILKCTNEIFDEIDLKINSLLNRKINKDKKQNLTFNIEVTDVTQIIDKFTNIYIDNLLLNDKNISSSSKRMLLYKLYFMKLDNSKDKENIIVIKNFDAYLNSDEIIEILNKIEELSNKNCHFILSTSSNILEYINLLTFSIYKVNNKITPLNNIDTAIKNYLLKRECPTTQDYEDFYNLNENLITKDEIEKIKENLLNNNLYALGKILNSNEIRMTLSKPKIISTTYHICQNKEELKLLEEICKIFID